MKPSVEAAAAPAASAGPSHWTAASGTVFEPTPPDAKVSTIRGTRQGGGATVDIRRVESDNRSRRSGGEMHAKRCAIVFGALALAGIGGCFQDDGGARVAKTKIHDLTTKSFVQAGGSCDDADECSRREAGFEYAKHHRLADPDDCLAMKGDDDFLDGCETYGDDIEAAVQAARKDLLTRLCRPTVEARRVLRRDPGRPEVAELAADRQGVGNAGGVLDELDGDPVGKHEELARRLGEQFNRRWAESGAAER